MKIIKYTIIFLATFLLARFIPMLYHLATDEASANLFAYYSSVEKSFCTIDFDEKEEKLVKKNVKTGEIYNQHEFDSILPMFYYRQLLADGRMPDSIHGIPVETKQISNKTFYFRYNPKEKNKPHIPLYTLFESFSGRVNLEMPGDVFRLKNKIEFINPETNSVNKEKNAAFMQIFQKRNFQFPPKIVAGNPSTRKPYDEGYFIVDSKNQLFHLKMVNGKPFLKNAQIPAEIDIAHISTIEPADRSFYAFIFDKQNKLYILSTDNYKLEEVPCPALDIDKDKLLIMANPLYWNVNVINKKGKNILALKADTKEVVDSLSSQRKNKKPSLASHLLPFSVSLTSSKSEFIKPAFHFGSYYALIFNFILVILFIFINKQKKNKLNIASPIWILITGIFGFIPCLIIDK